MNLEWQTSALEKIFEHMNPSNIYKKNQLIERNYDWASNMSWENQANKLLTEYILPNNKLEYKQLYNWTNSIPNEENKQQFLNIIEYFKQIYEINLRRPSRILEVGTYTGISLINIVKAIPNSRGIGIDRWINYENLVDSVNIETEDEENMKYMESLEIEKSFYKNIATENLSNRITGVKGDSKEILLNMLKNNEKFDFIYVDGSHKAVDCYLDIFLSWQLLNKGGILGIDDYMYSVEDKLGRPFESINQFLEENKGKYKMLHLGYRVFLEKM